MPENTKESIENFVTSALRSRLQESARSVIELRQQLNAALEKVESAIQIAGEKTISIPEDLVPEPSVEAASGDEAALLAHIHDAQQEMLATTEQVGLLTQFLLSCTVSCPRVAFFIVRKDILMGWAARGFEEAQDADVRNLSIGFDDDTILGAAYRSGAPVLGGPGQHAGDQAILEKLGGGAPAEAMAIPIFLRDKTAAVLYGDSGSEEAITNPELPQILALHAGLCLETLSTRQKFPRPKTSSIASRSSSSGPVTAQPPEEASVSSSQSSPAVGPNPSSLSGVFRKPEGLTPPRGVARSQPASAAPAAPPPAQEAAEVMEEAPEAVAEAAEVVEEAPAPAHEPAAMPEGLSDDDQKLHEEAKRFARLLVSEMVLYNEKQVEEGRRNKDIYDRLKDDIDRSRQMYEQRISAQVRESSNYFYDEMVRTLANGDQGALNVPWA